MRISDWSSDVCSSDLRGHKALAQLDYAQKRKTLTLQYRIPAFAWLAGWYTASLQFADEQTDYIDSRRIEFVASRSGQFHRHLNLVASLHVLRESWAYVAEDAGRSAARRVGNACVRQFRSREFRYN